MKKMRFRSQRAMEYELDITESTTAGEAKIELQKKYDFVEGSIKMVTRGREINDNEYLLALNLRNDQFIVIRTRSKHPELTNRITISQWDEEFPLRVKQLEELGFSSYISCYKLKEAKGNVEQAANLIILHNLSEEENKVKWKNQILNDPMQLHKVNQEIINTYPFYTDKLANGLEKCCEYLQLGEDIFMKYLQSANPILYRDYLKKKEARIQQQKAQMNQQNDTSQDINDTYVPEVHHLHRLSTPPNMGTQPVINLPNIQRTSSTEDKYQQKNFSNTISSSPSTDKRSTQSFDSPGFDSAPSASNPKIAPNINQMGFQPPPIPTPQTIPQQNQPPLRNHVFQPPPISPAFQPPLVVTTNLPNQQVHVSAGFVPPVNPTCSNISNQNNFENKTCTNTVFQPPPYVPKKGLNDPTKQATSIPNYQMPNQEIHPNRPIYAQSPNYSQQPGFHQPPMSQNPSNQNQNGFIPPPPINPSPQHFVPPQQSTYVQQPVNTIPPQYSAANPNLQHLFSNYAIEEQKIIQELADTNNFDEKSIIDIYEYFNRNESKTREYLLQFI